MHVKSLPMSECTSSLDQHRTQSMTNNVQKHLSRFNACKFLQIKLSHAHIMNLASPLSASHSSHWHSWLDEYVSHTHREPNRTRHWLWTDGAPFTKPPASIGMLNIAVFICHYCTPQSVSMGPARWVTAPSKSLKTSLAFSPQLHLLPIGPALGPWHQRGSARAAETLYKHLTHV